MPHELFISNPSRKYKEKTPSLLLYLAFPYHKMKKVLCLASIA